MKHDSTEKSYFSHLGKNASLRDITFHELSANETPVLFRIRTISIDFGFHSTSSCPVANKASTRSRQTALACADLTAFSHPKPALFIISPSIVLLHVDIGRPLFLRSFDLEFAQGEMVTRHSSL